MINDNTIVSSFNDRPTLLEWLKKVESALKTDTATAIKFVNTSPNHYVASIEFANGSKIVSGDIAFPDTIDQVTITDGELIVNYVSGAIDNLGKINAYADVIVVNSESNTTEIKNNAQVDGNLQVNGNVLFGNSLISIQGTTKQNGILGTNADGQIAFKEISGSSDSFMVVTFSNNATQVGNHEFSITTTISELEKNKLDKGLIKVISGSFKYNNGDTGYFYTSYCGTITKQGKNYYLYEGVNVNNSTSKLEKFTITYNTQNTENFIKAKFIQYAITQG